MSGWVVLAVGVVLCFLGVGSVHLAVLASAFGLGWLLADLFGATAGTALIIAAGSAVIAWALITLVFKIARFFIGLIAGALIGARLYAIFSPGDRSVVLAVVVVVATAIVFGFLADRYKGRVILWATAIGGAGLIISSLGLHLAGRPWFPAPPAGGLRAGDVLAVVDRAVRGRLVHPATTVPEGPPPGGRPALSQVARWRREVSESRRAGAPTGRRRSSATHSGWPPRASSRRSGVSPAGWRATPGCRSHGRRSGPCAAGTGCGDGPADSREVRYVSARPLIVYFRSSAATVLTRASPVASPSMACRNRPS